MTFFCNFYFNCSSFFSVNMTQITKKESVWTFKESLDWDLSHEALYYKIISRYVLKHNLKKNKFLRN